MGVYQQKLYALGCRQLKEMEESLSEGKPLSEHQRMAYQHLRACIVLPREIHPGHFEFEQPIEVIVATCHALYEKEE